MRRTVLAFSVALLAVSACGGNSKIVEVLRSTPGSTPSVTQSPYPSTTAPSGGPPRAIVVDTPQPQDEIVSPLTVSGTADVFEGVVSIRLLDAQGQELAAIASQASCGTGCRGNFSAKLAFVTQQRQAGLVQVFEANAEGGPPASLVEIPVTLVPGA